ncbi:ribulose-phosphate 3-epimerase [Macrococcus equipercicus]|uniref:Ribulose-phosphate 3-epimerase n=1 Tax=Macrococcus equipercicus TaxID=69967 RepID=A0ABQ6RC55_9STAP|nr:ribulose-phosphate 3-epimerase [Macrococcus equipercicus]KAA1042758.1 ribulose-phosphate 3-epimerase [Macrococcus equipercicus]
MVKIAPSLLSCDFTKLQEEVKKLEASGVDYLHYDVMDGQFVPNISFGLPILAQLRQITSLPIDSHLMIADPEVFVSQFADAGSDIITVHLEATPHIHRVLQMIRQKGKKAGVAVNPGTNVTLLEPVLSDVDLVLVMTVNPGFGGQSFIEGMVDKISYLDDYRRAHGLTYEIEVDGGINEETAALCRARGADVFVAGSYFFKHDDYNVPAQKLRGE